MTDFLHQLLKLCRAFRVPPRRRRFGPFPRGHRDFIPTLLRKGQLLLDFRPQIVHEIRALLAPPFNPLRGPFRPSRLSRSRRTPVVSLLSDEWLARQTDAATTPSADFCRPIREPCDQLSLDFGTRRQTSRGKFQCLPRTTAEFTFCALDGSGLRCLLPARPTLTPQIRFLYVGSRVCSTLLSDNASRRCPCDSLILHLHQVG